MRDVELNNNYKMDDSDSNEDQDLNLETDPDLIENTSDTEDLKIAKRVCSKLKYAIEFPSRGTTFPYYDQSPAAVIPGAKKLYNCNIVSTDKGLFFGLFRKPSTTWQVSKTQYLLDIEKNIKELLGKKGYKNIVLCCIDTSIKNDYVAELNYVKTHDDFHSRTSEYRDNNPDNVFEYYRWAFGKLKTRDYFFDIDQEEEGVLSSINKTCEVIVIIGDIVFSVNDFIEFRGYKFDDIE